MKRHAPAAARNRGPILTVLRRVFPERGRVLEVASGSGEHAVFFAGELPWLEWQPSERDAVSLASVEAWAEEAALPNLLAPFVLDVTEPWPIDRADAALCINMIHIAPWSACEQLFAGAGRILPAGAPLCLYGPYLVRERATAPSNEAFDASLRGRNPAWGIRWLHEVEAVARDAGFRLEETVDMPANNLTVVFRREA